jgi:hypothetical protein
MSTLRAQLRGRRVLYTDVQRRRLATAAKKLGRKALRRLDTLVTPDTLMRWYRRLVARKYDGTGSRGAGRRAEEPQRLGQGGSNYVDHAAYEPDARKA